VGVNPIFRVSTSQSFILSFSRLILLKISHNLTSYCLPFCVNTFDGDKDEEQQKLHLEIFFKSTVSYVIGGIQDFLIFEL